MKFVLILLCLAWSLSLMWCMPAELAQVDQAEASESSVKPEARFTPDLWCIAGCIWKCVSSGNVWVDKCTATTCLCVTGISKNQTPAMFSFPQPAGGFPQWPQFQQR